MKYLKDKNSRRRGVAIELAVGMLLIMVAMSTIIVATTMIQIEKQKNSVNNLDNLFTEIEMMEYDQIGIYFQELVGEEVSSLQSDSGENPLNNLSYVDLTSSKENRNDENHEYNKALKDFKDKIITRLNENLNKKFAILVKERNLVFNVSIDHAITQKTTKEQKFLKEEEKEIELTYEFEYDLTFSLTVEMIYGKDTKYPEFVASYNCALTQEVVYSSTYLRLYDLIPVEENVTYNTEIQPIEISIKAGHYINLSAVSNNIILETTAFENEYFTISGGDSKQQIMAKEGSQGQVLEVTLNYNKIIAPNNAPEVTDEGTENNGNFESKTLKIKITVEQENNEENQQPVEPVVNTNINNDILLIDEPIDGDNNQGTDPESPSTPQQVVNDITIVKQTGVRKEYKEEIGEKVPGSDIYKYPDVNVTSALEKVHWEYK